MPLRDLIRPPELTKVIVALRDEVETFDLEDKKNDSIV
jgi:hypothetical protein